MALDIEFWTQQLGVLPITLFPNQDKKDGQFVMLNGQHNNFCIDYNSAFDSEEYRSLAWSSGVDNFLEIKADKAILHSWVKQRSEEVGFNLISNK